MIRSTISAMSSELPSTVKPPWPWPDALDALTAAPAHHTLLFENERVRVVQTRIPAGQIVPVHTHRWSAVAFILAWSDLVRRDPEGNVTLDTRSGREVPRSNAPMWLEPLVPHSVENVGDTEFNAVQVEIKDAS